MKKITKVFIHQGVHLSELAKPNEQGSQLFQNTKNTISVAEFTIMDKGKKKEIINIEETAIGIELRGQSDYVVKIPWANIRGITVLEEKKKKDA
jgi:hypothetical protein